jgi:hypothetical protein
MCSDSFLFKAKIGRKRELWDRHGLMVGVLYGLSNQVYGFSLGLLGF